MGQKTTIGLKNVVFALLTKDDSTGVGYGTVYPLADAMTAKMTNKSDVAPQYADDQLGEVIITNSEIDVEFQQKAITLDNLATLLGHTISGGIMQQKVTDIAPYVAIGFMSMKSDRVSYEYHWLLKGVFSETDREFDTLADKSSPKYLTIKGTFMPRQYDQLTLIKADTNSATYLASVGTNWFTAVTQPADITLPTVTGVVPANSATGVSRTTTIIWTFSKSLALGTVNVGNFYLMSTIDGSIPAAASCVYNDTLKTVTLTLSGSLAATTKYIAIADNDITDLSGNHLVPANTTFTTGS